MIYEQHYAYHIFAHKHIALFLFRDEREQNHKDLENEFRAIAQDLKMEPDHEEVFFVISDISNAEQKKLADHIGIDYQHLP